MDGGHPLAGMNDRWEETVADMEATAAELREAGWETVELTPGAVTALPAEGDDGDGETDRVGFDVLVPDSEFEAVRAVVDDASFDAYEAFRAEAGGVVFLVVVMQAPDAGEAVLVPLYYRLDEDAPMVEAVRDAGESRVYVRPLDRRDEVVFVQRDPAALVPEA